jgi:uncharacterized protein (DUF1501 family)
MGTLNDLALTRRALLQLGVTGAALLGFPKVFESRAWGATGGPHFVVTFIADGGWDVTQVLDPHDPADASDGIDVDVPTAVSGLPPSQLTNVGGITYVSNPATRPAVDAFFANWAGRTAIVNGIGTRSTSHDQSRQLVLTGYLDPTRADFAVMAAAQNGPDLPLPHLLLSGMSFGGPFAGLSGRVGGSLGSALDYNRIPAVEGGADAHLAVSALGEAYVQQALSRLEALEPAGAISDRLGQFTDANDRADRLVRLASSLPTNQNNGGQLAASLAGAFRSGMTASVTISRNGGFDTHSDNTQQNGRWESLFGFLDAFVGGLAAEPGVAHASMLDETTIIYCSEFGRTPELNGDNGKDHHPWDSMLFVGKNVRPGTYGLTDGDQEGVKVNFATGNPNDAGQVLDVQNMVAGVLTLVGGNSAEYLPTVAPFKAMIV